MVLGGYGNFGRRISFALVKSNIEVIIVGRNQLLAERCRNDIMLQYPSAQVDIVVADINDKFNELVKTWQPRIVINTCGPFQLTDYRIAESCITHHVHYIDLADGREFVNGIARLNERALAHNVLVVSGASTVPGLSSAVISHYHSQFSKLNSLRYGITPGQQSPRGLATTQSILTYLGKPLKPYPGCKKTMYGWQQLYRQQYPQLGMRWMSSCDIPDLDFFSSKYNIESIEFSAGMENPVLHLGMWATSWLVRMGLLPNLLPHAEMLLAFSHVFDRFGSADGGMHMLMEGVDHEDKPKSINWFIIAKQGDGPQIPCVPAIVLAKQLLNGQMTKRGASACVEYVSLNDYLEELKGMAIEVIVESK